MVVQHNLPAVNAKGYCDKKVAGLKSSSEKLASGYRINRAGDDAAGLAVSEKIRTQMRGIKQAIRNSQDGINLIQTFEGALGETVSIIHRIGELAVQAANGTYDNPTDRAAIQLEFKQLSSEINQIADTDFNGLCMLNGGEMADGFTFITENGTMWLTPSEMTFPEDGFISTFKKVDGFPEIKMSIDILPEAKRMLTSDKELMQAFARLNDLSVRSFYNEGVPEFSLIGMKDEDKDTFSIETNGSSAIISITTAQSGKVPVARVSSTELPHYASSTGTGIWNYTSPATGRYTTPDLSVPENAAFDLEKYKETYVDGATATRAERQAYLDWIKATNAKATLENDTEFDKDTDAQKFVWSIDGQTYDIPVGADGTPLSSNSLHLPVYADTSKGPQIFFDNLHFYDNDELYKPTGSLTLTLGYSTDSNRITTTVDGKQVMAGNPSMSKDFYLNTWLDNGNKTVTLTYDRASDKWWDSIKGPTDLHDGSYYGIDDEYYSGNYWSSYYKNQNLKNFYEADGKLKDGFTMKVSVTTPNYRYISSSGMKFYPNSKNDEFCMEELDTANPAAGGIDYKVAKNGAKYTYDGLIQPDGTYGTWRNEAGEAVNLEDEGVYLPTNLSNYSNPLHDGMTITVSNPTMVGDDYIQARIFASDTDREVNAYRQIYDNITYSENLILQVGARTKDSVNFTFNYNSEGMGDLNNDLNCTAKGLGISELSLADQESANNAIDALGHALNKVSMIRASFGAIQNRLEHKISGLTVTNENLTEAESGIRDTDMALEMMKYTKDSILKEAAQTMLAQANQQPQSVLQLLGQ
ncbi:MAG: flagellin [Oscillospiraceae bacterium]